MAVTTMLAAATEAGSLPSAAASNGTAKMVVLNAPARLWSVPRSPPPPWSLERSNVRQGKRARPSRLGSRPDAVPRYLPVSKGGRPTNSQRYPSHQGPCGFERASGSLAGLAAPRQRTPYGCGARAAKLGRPWRTPPSGLCCFAFDARVAGCGAGAEVARRRREAGAHGDSAGTPRGLAQRDGAHVDGEEELGILDLAVQNEPSDGQCSARCGRKITYTGASSTRNEVAVRHILAA